jgi:bacterioferritin (cytochrome b1)
MESKQETVLQNEILAIQREMTHISMIDEFAKHARLQRQLNKTQEELKHRGTFIFKIDAIYFRIRV